MQIPINKVKNETSHILSRMISLFLYFPAGNIVNPMKIMHIHPTPSFISLNNKFMHSIIPFFISQAFNIIK